MPRCPAGALGGPASQAGHDARDASPGHPAPEAREGGTRVPSRPVCNAARSFGTPRVGFARMPRWGGRGFRVPILPRLGPSKRDARPGRSDVCHPRAGCEARPTAAGSPRGWGARPGTPPFAMPLGHLEPPGWDLPGCAAGVVGGSASRAARARPAETGCATRLLWVEPAGRESRASAVRSPQRRDARPGPRSPVRSAARHFGTPRVGFARAPRWGG